MRALISQAYERTVLLVAEHSHHVLALAERLISVETVNHDGLVQVLGPRPFVTDAYAQWMLTGAQEAQNRAEQERKAEADKRRAAATTAKGKDQGQGRDDLDTAAPQPILNPVI